MDLGLKENVVVITGGSKGIGFEIAKTFLQEGARVIIAARDSKGLELATSKLAGWGEISYFKIDVLKSQTIYDLAEFAFKKYSRIDIWINNVGASCLRSEGCNYSVEDISWTEKMCFDSVVLGSQAATKYMGKIGGSIINISSLAARCGTVGRSTLYGPLKAAVKELTVYQAAEYCSYGIRVNCVMPGFTLTQKALDTIAKEDFDNNVENTLLRRMATPSEIAKPVVFLASSQASYITGACLEVSGGRNIVLNPMYSYSLDK